MIRPLAEVTPGMILAGDVRDMSGRLLLSQGREITPRHLAIFKAWGIVEAHVVEEGPSQPVADDDLESLRLCQTEVYREQEARLREKFRFADPDHPMLAELFSYRLAQEIRRTIRE